MECFNNQETTPIKKTGNLLIDFLQSEFYKYDADT